MTQNAALSIDELTTVLAHRTVLDNVSLKVQPGEIVAIFGHNGAGKSTLLRCIMGAVRAAEGRIEFGFASWKFSPHQNASAGVSYLPQSRKLFVNMTVRDNLLVYSEAVGQDRKIFERNYCELATRFPILTKSASTLCRRLSGGEIQQVAIARAFLAEGNLLLLDEPTMGLAPQMRRNVFEAIATFAPARNCAVIIAEHRIAETLSLAQRGYILREGRIAYSGTAAELIANEEQLQSAVM